MKVSEAKNKVCPFIQHAALVALSAQSKQIDAKQVEDKHMPANINCLTNNCMSWVETKTRTDRHDLTEEEFLQMTPPEHYDKELPDDDKEGYCIRLEETEEQIVGIRQGSLNSINYQRFCEDKSFEYFGQKDDFLVIKKRSK